MRTALKHYEQALRIYPDFARAALALSIDYEKLGQPDRASYWSQRAVQKTPRLATAHYDLGIAYYYQGQPLAALAELWAAYELDPTQPDIVLALAMMMLNEGRDTTARSLVHQVEGTPNLNLQTRNALNTLDLRLRE